MADWTNIGGIIGGGTGDVLWMALLAVVIGGIALTIAIVGGLIYWNKKRWNLKVEIKLPRSDGKIINGEWGKGYFNSKRGVIFIKRATFGKAIPMEICDPKRFLQGDDLLTVLQISADKYTPVLNDSWTEVQDVNTGQKAGLLNIKIDTGLNKAWKSAFDASAKKAYSLQSFLQQFQVPIAIAIVVLACFVGFAIIWTRLGSIC